jgi:hypothetical protein
MHSLSINDMRPTQTEEDCFMCRARAVWTGAYILTSELIIIPSMHGHHCQPKKKKWDTTNHIYTPPSLRANSHTHLYTWSCCTHSRQSRYEHLTLGLSFSELTLVLLRSQYLRGLLLVCSLHSSFCSKYWKSCTDYNLGELSMHSSREWILRLYGLR